MKTEENKDLHFWKAESALEQMNTGKKDSRIHSIRFWSPADPSKNSPEHDCGNCRQLWAYNFGIWDSNVSYMAMWSDDDAGCGTSEITSFIQTYLHSANLRIRTGSMVWFLWWRELKQSYAVLLVLGGKHKEHNFWNRACFLFLVVLSWIKTQTLESLKRIKGKYHMPTFQRCSTSWCKYKESIQSQQDERQGICSSGKITAETCIPQCNNRGESSDV
jgi:hypothetical protein